MALDPHLESAQVRFCFRTLATLATSLKRSGALPDEAIAAIEANFADLQAAAKNSDWNDRDDIHRHFTMFNLG